MPLSVKLGCFVYRFGDTVPGERWRRKCAFRDVKFKATKPRLTHWYSYWNCVVTLKQVVFMNVNLKDVCTVCLLPLFCELFQWCTYKRNDSRNVYCRFKKTVYCLFKMNLWSLRIVISVGLHGSRMLIWLCFNRCDLLVKFMIDWLIYLFTFRQIFADMEVVKVIHTHT